MLQVLHQLMYAYQRRYAGLRLKCPSVDASQGAIVMAAISKELSNSLNVLRQAIEAAEAELAKIPCAETVRAPVSRLVDDRGNSAVIFVRVRGKKATIFLSYPDLDGIGQFNDSETALEKLPVSQRVIAAESIPNLIERAIEVENKLPERLIQVATKIRESLE